MVWLVYDEFNPKKMFHNHNLDNPTQDTTRDFPNESQTKKESI